MASRLFASSPSSPTSTPPAADTGTTVKGNDNTAAGGGKEFLIYQTSAASAMEIGTNSDGDAYSYVRGPEETSGETSFYIAFQNTNLDTTDAADPTAPYTLKIGFWGVASSSTSNQKIQQMNQACASIVRSDPTMTALIEGAGFPFALDGANYTVAALALNGISGTGSASGIKLGCIVIEGGTIIVT